MTTVDQGAQVTLLSQWAEYPGGPAVDLAGVTITITRITGAVVVVGPTGTGISHPATGVYTYTWAVPQGQALGAYLATWSGTDSSGDAVTASEAVTVVATTAAGLTAVDLALYLGQSDIDADRADLLISQATVLAESVVKPLPAAATAIVLAMAGRAYANPQGVTSETIGPYTVSRPQAGLYMTKAETAALKRLGGRGGAFTVDPTPQDASPAATWPRDVDPDRWQGSRLWADAGWS